MQRGVGEHASERGLSGRYRVGHRVRWRGGPLSQQDNGGRCRGEQAFLGRIDKGMAPGGGKIWHHYRKGFFFPVLASPELGNRFGIQGIHHQVKASKSLNREDFALFKQGAGLAQRGIPHLEGSTRWGEQLEGGSAIPTGVGLGMEPTIGWVVIFGLTG